MSEADVKFGYRCARCGTTIGVSVSVGAGGSNCPSCGGPMVPATGPDAPESLANYRCPNCNSQFGLVVSTGPISACPECGHPID